jgi:hypothetical protein
VRARIRAPYRFRFFELDNIISSVLEEFLFYNFGNAVVLEHWRVDKNDFHDSIFGLEDNTTQPDNGGGSVLTAQHFAIHLLLEACPTLTL